MGGRYFWSVLIAALSLGLYPVLKPYSSQLSKPEIYMILFVMFVLCFAVGKLWPNLFTEKKEALDAQVLPSVEREGTEDVEYYIKHKKLLWISYALVLIFIIKTLLHPDKI